MSVEYRTGDLFEQIDAEGFAHGVNSKGVMGAGIAPQFKYRWPEMYRQYRLQCQAGLLSRGKVFTWLSAGPDPTVIFNLVTQNSPGSNATYTALERCLTQMITIGERLALDSIALPRIGCGIGGLYWPRVKGIIEAFAQDTDLTITVVSRPGDPE